MKRNTTTAGGAAAMAGAAASVVHASGSDTIKAGLLLVLAVVFGGCRGSVDSAGGGEGFVSYPIGKIVKDGGRTFIVLDKKYEAGLLGLEKHSYVTVVYWFDKNDTPQRRAILQVHPRGDNNNPLTGVFATHSPVRPNLIAISKCDIISVEENVIEVKDIDAFDGSPVLDLKGDFFGFNRPGSQR